MRSATPQGRERVPGTPYTIERHSDGHRVDVEEFWYSVYVTEMGLDLPTADHTTKRIHDPFVEGGHLLIARDEAERVAGTVLAVLGRERSLGYYAELFQIRDDPADVSVTSKILIGQGARKTRLVFSLAAAAYRFGVARGVLTDYCDSQRATLPLFRRLGYRRMPGTSQHPIYGPSIRMRLDCHDQAHLDACGSPLAGELRALGAEAPTGSESPLTRLTSVE